MPFRYVKGDAFIQALIDQKLVPEDTMRVVIDAKAGDVVYLHYKTTADNTILEVVGALAKDVEVESRPS